MEAHSFIAYEKRESMSAKIEERVEEIVRGLLTDVPELELVDVEYVRERGKQVDVTLYAPFDGKKQWTGALTDCDGKTLTLDDGIQIPMEQVSQIRLHIDF